VAAWQLCFLGEKVAKGKMVMASGLFIASAARRWRRNDAQL
jgi:hypothetical protein